MAGYTVLEAEDGHTALELAAMHSGPIHVLMTDVVMPGINGRELASASRSYGPEPRSSICPATQTRPSCTRAFSNPAPSYFRSPSRWEHSLQS